jgi:ketosteroid isomerase-like protein
VLDAVVAEQLSYGHSGGRVDTKQSFIGDLVNGKSDFVTLDLTDQAVVLTGDVALIRHALNAKTNDAGTPGAVSLKVLQVWQRQGGQWKLVARQAVRTPT